MKKTTITKIRPVIQITVHLLVLLGMLLPNITAAASFVRKTTERVTSKPSQPVISPDEEEFGTAAAEEFLGVQAASPSLDVQTPSGDLYFAAEIDLDEDPSTNPVRGQPVPVIQLAGDQYAITTLAVKVMGNGLEKAPGGVPVTFEVWKNDQAYFRQTVRADAWGAAVLDVPYTDTTGTFTYQASAPGYGQTEVRSFIFNPFEARYALTTGKIVLSREVLEKNLVRLKLTSTRSLEEFNASPILAIYRKPSTAPTLPDGLEELSAQVGEHGLYLPLPVQAFQVLDEHTAIVDLILPEGDYRLMAYVDFDDPSELSLSDLVDIHLESSPTLSADALITWASPLEHEAGQKIAMYDLEDGKIAYGLVDSASLTNANLQAAAQEWVQLPGTITSLVRRGPFTWMVESFAVEETRPGDTTALTLSSLSYDPILQEFSLAWQAGTEDRNVTVSWEALGRNDARIGQGEWTDLITAGERWDDAIRSSDGLGKPQGLIVTASDPDTGELLYQAALKTNPTIELTSISEGYVREALERSPDRIIVPEDIEIPKPPPGEEDQVVRDTSEVGNKSLSRTKEIELLEKNKVFSIKFKFEIKISGFILGVEIVNKAYAYPEGEWGDWSWKSVGAIATEMTEAAFYQAWTRERISLGAGTGMVSLGFEAKIKFDPCNSIFDTILGDRLVTLADRINQIVANSEFYETGKAGEVSKKKLGPWFGWLMWWVDAGAGGEIAADASAADLEFTLFAKFKIDATLNAGIALPDTTDLEEIKDLYLMVGGVFTAVDIALILASFMGREIFGNCGFKNIPDKQPADDRQDAYQQASGVAAGKTAQDTINNLHLLIGLAREHGLVRAERVLTYQLREQEFIAFGKNQSGYNEYRDAHSQILKAAYVEYQAILSGTLVISPTEALTETIIRLGEETTAQIDALPYGRLFNQVNWNMNVAQFLYEGLYGQEAETQAELDLLMRTSAVGVLASGLPWGIEKAMTYTGIPYQFVGLWPGWATYRGKSVFTGAPEDAPRTLVVPTAGLDLVVQSPYARQWLDDYVYSGGTLLVFAQPSGAEWEALPGGQVRGIGYQEDQRCEQESVRAAAPSKWLMWMGEPTPDIQVDGVFTSWPPEATPLLLRRSGFFEGFPAMIEYPYGEGNVLATTAYGDWAVESGLGWGDDWQMTRSLLSRLYLLTNGQDIEDVPVYAPNTNISPAFVFANTASFTTTQVQTLLPVYGHMSGKIGNRMIQTSPLALETAPEAMGVFTPTLKTPATRRGIHNWTQSGLFRLVTAVTTEGGKYDTWGPIFFLPGPDPVPDLVISLSTPNATARPLTTIPVTATIANYTENPQTLVLSGLEDFPTTPITLTVPANGTAVHPYSIYVDTSLRMHAGAYDLTGTLVTEGFLAVPLSIPNLQVTALLDDGLDLAEDPLQIRITNRPLYQFPSRELLTSTLALTLTAPSGGVLWTDQLALPFIQSALSAIVSTTIESNLPWETGIYWLDYAIHEEGALMREGHVSIPSGIWLWGEMDSHSYDVSQAPVANLNVENSGYFPLESTLEVLAPSVNFSETVSLTLPANSSTALPITFTLPLTLPTGSYPVQAVLETQGFPQTDTFGFTILPPYFAWETPEENPPGGGERAASSWTLTLKNQGGSQASTQVRFRLIDWVGNIMATTEGDYIVPFQGEVEIVVAAPEGLVSGAYRLETRVEELTTGQSYSRDFAVELSGLSPELIVSPDQPRYVSGETISIVGSVAPARVSFTGTLDLEITRASAASIEVGPSVMLNSNEETGVIEHEDPAVIFDGDGNVHAVWVMGGGYLDKELVYGFLPAGSSSWEPSILITPTRSNQFSQSPAIAVDDQGGVHIAWEYMEDDWWTPWLYYAYKAPGNDTFTHEWIINLPYFDPFPTIAVTPDGAVHIAYQDYQPSVDILYVRRAPGGGWSAPIRVNDDLGSTSQYRPEMAVDASGNLYLAWYDFRNSGQSWDVYFDTKPMTGTWGTDIKVSQAVDSSQQVAPDIAVSATGQVYIVWEDTRGADLYFRYRAADGTWDNEVKVATRNQTQYSPRISLDGAGVAHIVWYEKRQSNWAEDIVYANRAVNGTWGNFQVVNDDGTTVFNRMQFHPDVAANAAGDVIAVWRDPRPGTWDIFFGMRSGGVWGTSSRVPTITGGAGHDLPDLVGDGAGGIYAAWHTHGKWVDFAEKPAGGTWQHDIRLETNASFAAEVAANENGDVGVVYIVGTATFPYDIYARIRPAGGAWLPAQKVSTSTNTRLEYPAIALDAAGNAYVLWKVDGFQSNPDSLMFAYRPAGGAWQTPVRVDDNVTHFIGIPQIAVDPAGNAHAIWGEDRNGTWQMFSAYRPAGGSWGLNELVSTPGIAGGDGGLVVDDAGNVYAIWSGNQHLSLGYRPAGGTWSQSELFTSSTFAMNEFDPAIALDSQGDLYISYNASGSWNGEGYSGAVFLSKRTGKTLPLAEGWTEPVLMSSTHDLAGDNNALGLAGPGEPYVIWKGSRDIYAAGAVIVGGSSVVYTTTLPINASARQAISESVGTLGGESGKYWVAARLWSAVGQKAGTQRTPFYIQPGGVELALETGREYAYPGELISASGWLTNTGAVPLTDTLTIQIDGATVHEQPYSLPAGSSMYYTFTQVVHQDALVVVEASGAEASEMILVAAPQVEAELVVPEFVGHAPFSATVVVTNTGAVPFSARAEIGGFLSPDLDLLPGESTFFQAGLVGEYGQLVTATLTGDVSLDLVEYPGWGEDGRIAFSAPAGDLLAGSMQVSFVISNTWVLPTLATASFWVDTPANREGGSPEQTFMLLPGQPITGVVVVQAPAGIHNVHAALSDQSGRLLDEAELELHVLPSGEEVGPAIQILDVTVGPVNGRAAEPRAGDDFVVSMLIENQGPAAPVIVGIQAFDLPYQWVFTPTAFSTSLLTATLPAPADLPSGKYVGSVWVDDQFVSFEAPFSGPNVKMDLTTGQPVYQAGEMVDLTVTLTEAASLSGEYHLSLSYLDEEEFITVTLPAGEVLNHSFNFTATTSDRAAVMLSFTPQAGEEGQRVIMIDSLPIQVSETVNSVSVTFDKPIYQAGETMVISVTIDQPTGSVMLWGLEEVLMETADFLLWAAPREESGEVVTGTHVLTFTLPPLLETGVYTFKVLADGQEVSLPVDVQGVMVNTYDIHLDQSLYQPGDTIEAVVKFWNAGAEPLLGVYLATSLFATDEGALPGQAGRGLTLVDVLPGLNTFTTTAILDTEQAGPHRFSVALILPGELWNLATAVAQFDVGSGFAIALNTDQGIYYQDDPGTGTVDLFGYGLLGVTITDTLGNTLMDQQVNLDGFTPLTFTLDTGTYGDTQVFATTEDSFGTKSRLETYYSVPLSLDQTPPVISLTDPATHTVIVTNAPTMTVVIGGLAEDERGVTEVVVNGELATLEAGGEFTGTIMLKQGVNLVYAAARDAKGNYTYTPYLYIQLVPEHTLEVDAPSQVQVGDAISIDISLEARQDVDGVTLFIPISEVLVGSLVLSAEGGEADIVTVGGVPVVTWLGTLEADTPVTLTIQGIALAEGTLNPDGIVGWAGGLEEELAFTIQILPGEGWPFLIFLPLITR